MVVIVKIAGINFLAIFLQQFILKEPFEPTIQ